MPVASRKHRSNPAWLRRHLDDPYVKAATLAGYRSRAAYKLIGIDDRDRLLRPGLTVVELGAAPGSWTQVVRERLRDRQGQFRGRIVALDLLPFDPVADVESVVGDFREQEVAEALSARLGERRVDVVLSDMAPNLSGIGVADAAAMTLLAELAVEFAMAHLKADGALVIKAFQGSGYSQLVQMLKGSFVAVASRKPPASRAESAETYLLARRPRATRAATGEVNPKSDPGA
jgi:23S rRNA (uridine2552-2'-O)-methyltransferase